MTARAATSEPDADDEWSPTPPDKRIRARLLDGTIIEYSELKPGNVFQAILPDGTTIHPLDTEEEGKSVTDEVTFAVCMDAPVRGWRENPGWAVPVEAGARDDMIALARQFLS